MYLQEIITKNHIREFLDFPDNIYKEDSNYIRPLDKDIESIFNVNENSFFQKGKCSRWLLLDNSNKIIGRVAVFFTKENDDKLFGGLGFFECVNSQEAANYIFDHCKKWLQSHGVEVMQGPINFGERMKFWGLLVEGFQEPLYAINYNPAYYQTLFENYGFKISYKQNCYSLDLNVHLPDKFYRVRDILNRNSDYQLQTIRKNNLEKYARDFASIYNEAWAQHEETKELEEKEAIKLFNNMKPVIDEDVVWFAYHKDKPIGFWVNLPNLNDYFKNSSPKFGLISMLKFFFYFKLRPTKHLVGLVFGVIPEFQNKGVDAYMIVNALDKIKEKNTYNFYEVQWIGDFNPKMNNLIKHMEGKVTRTFITYEYLINDK